MKKRTGLYFGSFNPIHMGHLIIAEYILDKGLVDDVWMVISPLNPFKKKSGLLDHHERYKLLKKAVYGNKCIVASDIEFDLPIPSYTIDTLTVLKRKFSSRSFSLVMGEDNLEHFDKWKSYREILDEHQVYVYPRLSHETNKFDSEENIIKVNAPILELSSTEIRHRIKEGRSIRYLTRESVRKEILMTGAYK